MWRTSRIKQCDSQNVSEYQKNHGKMKKYRSKGVGNNCAPLVADLFCYERDFVLSLSGSGQTDIIEAFNSTSRYLDEIILILNKL